MALLLVTVLWGFTFVWMKQGIDAAERVLGPAGGTAGIGLFMSLRFGLAALSMLAFPSVRAGLGAGAWSGGLAIGALLVAGFLLQMFGLRGVSAPVSAFLTSLYVIFTALLTSLRERRAHGWPLALGALLSTFGAGFIQGPPQLAFGLAEWLTVGCAFVFALHILATEHVTRRMAPLPVTFTSFVWVTLGSLATLGAGLAGGDRPDSAALVRLALDPGFAWPMALSSILATVLALSLMNVYQRELDPVRAAILYAVEPIWATLVAIGIGQTEAGPWLLVGGLALVVGNLIAELGPVAAGRSTRPGEVAG
jgi:drug/metabolite transporter (DMT)-like permease